MPHIPPALPRLRLTRRAAAALAAPIALALLAACGSGETTSAATPDPTTASVTASSFPVTVSAANGEVTIAEQPTKIVSLAPTATETLFAIGAGEQVVAVDDQSDYPEQAPRTKLSGFQPNAEAVAAYQPDLVVASNDANGLVDSLEALKIPTLLLPAAATLDEAYEQIETLGTATGNLDTATDVRKDVEARIAAAVASVPATAKGLKIYHELDPSFYTVTSKTFIGSIYSLFGLTNIADAAADQAGGYPQLSAEFIVKAAPDVIVLADSECCGQSQASVAKRPAFDTVPAVKNGMVVTVSDDVASRWGPRTADFAEAVAAALAKAGS